MGKKIKQVNIKIKIPSPVNSFLVGLNGREFRFLLPLLYLIFILSGYVFPGMFGNLDSRDISLPLIISMLYFFFNLPGIFICNISSACSDTSYGWLIMIIPTFILLFVLGWLVDYVIKAGRYIKYD